MIALKPYCEGKEIVQYSGCRLQLTCCDFHGAFYQADHVVPTRPNPAVFGHLLIYVYHWRVELMNVRLDRRRCSKFSADPSKHAGLSQVLIHCTRLDFAKTTKILR
jgi:hypothetical protein